MGTAEPAEAAAVCFVLRIAKAARAELDTPQSVRGWQPPSELAVAEKEIADQRAKEERDFADLVAAQCGDPRELLHWCERARDWLSKYLAERQIRPGDPDQHGDTIARHLWEQALLHCDDSSVTDPLNPEARHWGFPTGQVLQNLRIVAKWCKGQGETGQEEEVDDTEPGADREELIQGMKRSVRLAYLGFAYAESKAGKRLADQEAYQLLAEEGIPGDAGDRGELTEFRLPSFITWARQLRDARKALCEQKYTRRSGRPIGKSIVRGDQVENLQDTDQ